MEVVLWFEKRLPFPGLMLSPRSDLWDISWCEEEVAVPEQDKPMLGEPWGY